MTKRDEYNLLVARYNTLKDSPKNIKCGGVLRKIRRKLRNMEKDI